MQTTNKLNYDERRIYCCFSFKMVSLVVSIFLKTTNRNRDINFKMLNINLIQYHVMIPYLIL